MATIKDKNIIKILLQNNGIYPGDPPTIAIFSYENLNAPGEHFALFYRREDIDIDISPYVGNYKELFAFGKLTKDGEIWLERFNASREEKKDPCSACGDLTPISDLYLLPAKEDMNIEVCIPCLEALQRFFNSLEKDDTLHHLGE